MLNYNKGFINQIQERRIEDNKNLIGKWNVKIRFVVLTESFSHESRNPTRAIAAKTL